MTEQRMVTWSELPQARKDQINAAMVGLIGLTHEDFDAFLGDLPPEDRPPEEAIYPLLDEHAEWLRETRARVKAMPWWKRWMYWCPEDES